VLGASWGRLTSRRRHATAAQNIANRLIGNLEGSFWAQRVAVAAAAMTGARSEARRMWPAAAAIGAS
jgi:hypothetical protein